MSDRDAGWRVIGDIAVDSAPLALVDPQNEVDPQDFLDRTSSSRPSRAPRGTRSGS
jgi:hypothetical protein